MKKKIGWLVLSGLVVMGLGCGEDDPLAEAWKRFRDGDYAGAHAAFSDLSGSEALVGLGWTTLRMDSIAAADGYFQQAAGDSLVAGYAGWGLVKWVLGQYPSCIQCGDFVLQRAGATFVFDEDRSVTYKDVLWHQASSYYHLGNLEACIAKIQQIDESWVAPDLSDPDLETILLRKLEELFGELGVTL
jgi:hypothetical protein